MSSRHKFGGDILAIFGGHTLFRSSGFWSNSARCRAPPWCLVQILGHHLSHLTNAVRSSPLRPCHRPISPNHTKSTSNQCVQIGDFGCNTQLHFSSKMKEAQLVTGHQSLFKQTLRLPQQPTDHRPRRASGSHRDVLRCWRRSVRRWKPNCRPPPRLRPCIR